MNRLTTSEHQKLKIDIIKDVEVFKKLHLTQICWLFEGDPTF
ncbi:hypothetical protein [Leptospira interrogans]|nr:hypothetical protein [Leptospira interrogans]EMN82575.1 hypothetical protein LEP1GSC106_4852 [Leptospira interrogans serovar Grippotyphosa str. UI 12764]